MAMIYDERICWKGFHGCDSHCQVRVYQASPVAEAQHLIENHSKHLSDPDRFFKSEPVSASTVVIASEGAICLNPGTSITNNAEIIFKLVCDRYNLDPMRVIWIEHYDYQTKDQSRDHGTTETFDRVFFEIGGKHVIWNRSSLVQVERLIGTLLNQ